jgi:glycosyltransferase involved in cell wall biosynthesis
VRILIDGIFLKKARGLGRYIKEYIYNISVQFLFSDWKFFILIPQSDVHSVKQFLDYVKKPWIEPICAPSLPYPLWEQCVLPFYTLKLGVDILHAPYNTVPLVSKVKRVITVHDLMFMRENPGASLYQKLGNVYRKYVLSRAIGGVEGVISVSDSTAKEIEKMFGLRPKVIPNTVDFYIKQMQEQYNSREALSYLATLSLEDKKYFLHIGGISKHKNTFKVITAFLKANLKDYKLVILGASYRDFKRYLRIESYSNDSLVFPGIVDDKTLGFLYKHAYALVFPSLMEGFGLPILEARAFDLPIITSNISPMKDLASDCSLLVNPLSEEEIVLAFKKLLDPHLYASLSERASSIFDKISSRSVSRQVYEFYNSIGGNF